MTTRNLHPPAAASSALTPEERAKYDDLLRWIRAKQAEYANASPEELAREEAEWQAVLRTMNEERARAGMRRLTVDPE